MYALTLARCAPLGIVRTYQAMHTCLCYNYYISYIKHKIYAYHITKIITYEKEKKANNSKH